MQFWDEEIPGIIVSYWLALVLEELVFESHVESYTGTAYVRMDLMRNLYRINLIVRESLESRATERLWLCW